MSTLLHRRSLILALAAALVAGTASIELPDPLAHRASRARTVRYAVVNDGHDHHAPEAPVAILMAGTPVVDAALAPVGRALFAAEPEPRDVHALPGRSRAPPSFS